MLWEHSLTGPGLGVPSPEFAISGGRARHHRPPKALREKIAMENFGSLGIGSAFMASTFLC